MKITRRLHSILAGPRETGKLSERFNCVINCLRLTELARTIQSDFPQSQIHLVIELGSKASSNLGIAVINADAEAAVQVSDEQRARYQRRLDQLLITASQEQHPFVSVMEKTLETACDEAVQSSLVEFRRWLLILRTLVEADGCRPKEITLDEGFAVDCPSLVDLSFNLVDLIDSVWRTEDEAKVQELFRWGYRLIDFGIEHESPDCLEHGITVTRGLYRRSLQSGRLVSMIADHLDDALHSILFRLDCRNVDRQRRRTRSPDDERWLLNKLLEWSLRLVKLAIENDRPTDATRYIDRVFEYDSWGRIRRE